VHVYLQDVSTCGCLSRSYSQGGGQRNTNWILRRIAPRIYHQQTWEANVGLMILVLLGLRFMTEWLCAVLESQRNHILVKASASADGAGLEQPSDVGKENGGGGKRGSCS